MSGKLCCRCSAPIDIRGRWEDRMTGIQIDIQSCCCATRKLWGDLIEDDRGFNHPAILPESGYQCLLIEYGHDKAAALCWNCHSDFLAHLGNFMKQQLPPNSRHEP